MTTNTNEIDSAAYVAAAPTTAADTMPTLPSIAVTKDDGSPAEDPGNDIGMDVTLTDAPVTNRDIRPANVSIYTNNITPVSTDPESTIVYFDVVFSVSIQDESNDQISTHQVVKRIGVDKMKIANDTALATPSIVEAKKPVVPEQSAFSAARIKALAGIK